MKARSVALSLAFAALLASGMEGQKGSPKSAASPAHATSQQPAAPDGEKLFREHCGRCHAAPEELSPRVARAVIQHMRVRAMLSRQDQQAILSYIAPE